MSAFSGGYARQGTFLLLASCLILFHFGWLKFFGHGEAVYIMDWAIRLAILSIAWEALKQGMSPWYPVVRVRDWLIGFACAYLLVLTSDFAIEIIFYLLFDLQPTRYMGYPALPPGPFLYFDLAFGLLLVGLTEEVVYRKLFVDWWWEKGWRTWSLYLVSATAFGLLHANQGPLRFPETFVWGLFMMWIYRRTNSLRFVVLLHWLTDILYAAKRYVPYYTMDNAILCDLAPKCMGKETWEFNFGPLP